MKFALTLSCVLVLLLGTATSRAEPKQPTKKSVPHHLLVKVQKARMMTHRCQDTLGVERYPVSKGNPKSEAFVRWQLGLWTARKEAYCDALKAVRKLYSIDEATVARQWAESSGPACISSNEGGVTTNTGNGYYGKWQADLDFQGDYGSEFVSRWGVASNWPEWAQDIMAYRAYQSRGYGPWPNTRRYCGV